MDVKQLTDALTKRAKALGFSLVGASPAATPQGAARLDAWLAAGYAGRMDYIANRRAAYDHPQSVLDGVRSLLMLAMDYRTLEPREPPAGHGRIARYAWGAQDYHDAVRARLNILSDLLQELAPGSSARGVVDTAPLMERDFAQLAGLGWIGKNTLLLNREHGSWFFLAALLTDAELAYDTPHETDHCGTCRACLDACPTDAFPKPYVLDASRCISYLTIELKEAIPVELREDIGDWVFGCDVCQDVCPWNNHAPRAPGETFAPLDANNPADLIALLDLDDQAFRDRFRHTPLWRPRRRGILRNAAIVLGNRPTPVALRALAKGLHDDEPLVRGACAWALGNYPQPAARAALKARREVEPDPETLAEIEAALQVHR
jgi:epoxyqueuosine reductase